MTAPATPPAAPPTAAPRAAPFQPPMRAPIPAPAAAPPPPPTAAPVRALVAQLREPARARIRVDPSSRFIVLPPRASTRKDSHAYGRIYMHFFRPVRRPPAR